MHSVAHGIAHLAEADRDEDHPDELDAEEDGKYDEVHEVEAFVVPGIIHPIQHVNCVDNGFFAAGRVLERCTAPELILEGGLCLFCIRDVPLEVRHGGERGVDARCSLDGVLVRQLAVLLQVCSRIRIAFIHRNLSILVSLRCVEVLAVIKVRVSLEWVVNGRVRCIDHDVLLIGECTEAIQLPCQALQRRV